MSSLRCAACLLAVWSSIGLTAEKKILSPKTGQEFVFSPEAPKHMTCNIDFRDPTDKLWPNFVGGRGTGRLVYDAAGPKGEFTITFDRLNQKNGEQSRRVLGEWIKPDQPFAVILTVTSIGPFSEESIEETDSKGKVKAHTALVTKLGGTLDVAGHRIPFEAKTEAKAGAAKGSENVESLYLSARWTFEGKDLGLKSEGATGPIEVYACIQAFNPQSLPKPKNGK